MVKLALLIVVFACVVARAHSGGVPLVAVSTEKSGPWCNGVALAGGWVLTAQHCLAGDVAFLRMDGDTVVRGSVKWMGGAKDIALLEANGARGGLRLAKEVAPAFAATPLWVATPDSGVVTAELVSVDDDYIRVRVPGSGLCHGNSGTPLVMRRGERYLVVGVLDVGDRRCSPEGQYRFVRADGNRIPRAPRHP